MKSPYKFMQGASKSTGKSLDLQGFLTSNIFLAKHYKSFLTLSDSAFILNQLLIVFDTTNCF